MPFVFGVVHEHRAAHRRIQANLTRELAALDTPVVNTYRHAKAQCRIVHYAVAHECVRSLFLARILRNIHLNPDSGIATHGGHRVRIARRANLRDRLEFLLGILGSFSLVRQQVHTRSVIVHVLAERVLERLADGKHAVGLHHRNPELVVAQGVATPEVRNAIRQRLAQVPVVHAPHHDAARRKSRIVGIEPDNQALRLLLVLVALALHAHAVLEHEVQAIHGNRTNARLRIRSQPVHCHVNRSFLVPAALTVFNQQVFARAERHLYNLGSLARTRGCNIHRHGFPCHRTHFLHLRPAHVGTFPRGRQRRQEPVTSIVARKIHHVVITEAADSLHHVVGVREPDFARNLVHDDSVYAPVEAILRGSLAHHHYRTERIDSTARNADSRRRGIAGARKPDYGFCGLAPRGICLQVLPVVTGNVDVHEVARSICALRAHASAIHKAACARVYNHVRALHVRILRNRNAERSLLRGIGGGSGNGIVNKREVVTAAGLVIFGRLFALLLARAVIIDNRLGQRIDGRTRGWVREHARLHDQVPAAHRIEIIVGEFKMLEPVQGRAAVFGRIQAIGILVLLVGIESAVARSERVIRVFLLELDAQRKYFERIYSKRLRNKTEYTQKQCK